MPRSLPQTDSPTSHRPSRSEKIEGPRFSLAHFKTIFSPLVGDEDSLASNMACCMNQGTKKVACPLFLINDRRFNFSSRLVCHSTRTPEYIHSDALNSRS